jgi:hypothetical protein
MKLGEALALRADLQKRANQIQALLYENASVQEGDRPAVEPETLLEEYARIAAEHEALVRRINRTNLMAEVVATAEPMTLADAVVRRDRLAREAKLLRDVASRATPKGSRYLRTEVKHVPTIAVADLLARADRLSRQHRELDVRIQQTNWEVEVIE